MNAREQEAARLEQILPWARLAGELRIALRPHEQGLHLRPSATGIRIVDLSPSRPQLDRGQISSPVDAAQKLERLMAAQRDDGPGRSTPEKSLQAWMIADAYRHQGVMRGLSKQLMFVTDEQVIYDDSGKVVCDLLAVRHGSTSSTPVAIELKSKREMTRLVAQLEAISRAIDRHLDGFARLFSALLQTDIRLVAPAERWIVWPATSHSTDPRADELRVQRIAVKGYKLHGDGYYIS